MRIHAATRSVSCLAVLALGLATLPAAGQAPAPAPPPELRREVFRVDTEVVLLDVVARDKKGRTVRDLRPEEIEVYEDGVRQEIGKFRFLDSTGDRRGHRGRRPGPDATAVPRPRRSSRGLGRAGT